MSICSLFARLFAHCSLNHFSANLNLDPRPPVASIDRIVAEAKALREIGIGTIAIMPNIPELQDSFDNMKAFSARHRAVNGSCVVL
jgi:hypothetical protein